MITRPHISPETQGDASSIGALMDDVFGPDRFGRTVYRFRKNIAPISEHGYVARLDGVMVGSIRFWPIEMPDGTTAPLLGPLAVKSHLRGIGIGQDLVRRGLLSLEDSGAPGVLIVGDPGYYAPFGFSVDCVANLDLGGPVVPLTFMGLEFQPGVLSVQSGILHPKTDSRLQGAATDGPVKPPGTQEA